MPLPVGPLRAVFTGRGSFGGRSGPERAEAAASYGGTEPVARRSAARLGDEFRQRLGPAQGAEVRGVAGVAVDGRAEQGVVGEVGGEVVGAGVQEGDEVAR